MKILWLVSFRPLGKSKINDFYQSLFVDSIKSINEDITFSLTQFDEENVKEFIEKKKIKTFFKNIPKERLPKNKKYSNKLMLDNALEQYLENEEFEYLVYSTADVIVPNNLFRIISNIKKDRFCSLIFPNTHVKNSTITNNFWPHYGIDIIVFKINRNDVKKLQQAIVSYNQYDWGINENFYISVSELLNLEIYNLFKNCNAIKFENDFETFVEDRSWQIDSWYENQKYFINFLNKNKLSKMYAYGSYYYLLYKIFNLRDLNLRLILSYLIFYPYNFTKKILSLIFKINRK